MRNLMLMFHFLGLVMGVGTGIANLYLSRAASKMEKSEALKFMLSISVLGKMGMTGLTLLILSGGYLITPFWSNLANMPTLIAKLCLVLVLITLLGIIAYNSMQLKKGDPGKYLKRLKILGPVTLLVSLTIIALAVITFH